MKILASSCVVVLSMCGAGMAGGASAADLFRHHSRHHYVGRHLLHPYREDAACQAFEPTEYEPRTLNFRQPLCYAARPYGISQHLYDYSTLLRGSSTDELGY